MKQLAEEEWKEVGPSPSDGTSTKSGRHSGSNSRSASRSSGSSSRSSSIERASSDDKAVAAMEARTRNENTARAVAKERATVVVMDGADLFGPPVFFIEGSWDNWVPHEMIW